MYLLALLYSEPRAFVIITTEYGTVTVFKHKIVMLNVPEILAADLFLQLGNMTRLFSLL